MHKEQPPRDLENYRCSLRVHCRVAPQNRGKVKTCYVEEQAWQVRFRLLCLPVFTPNLSSSSIHITEESATRTARNDERSGNKRGQEEPKVKGEKGEE